MSKNYERKIKLPFMIYTDFESILAPKDTGKQNLIWTESNRYEYIRIKSYTNKYQKYVACSYSHKLVSIERLT